jgi:2-polyprenyl-6-methoxyphenol hydroxylase-like FAD-dependent oxidoreductase
MSRTQEVDVAIVGGGPCGLALALGLVQCSFSVAVIEKNKESSSITDPDWSKQYSYRIDVRGISLLERIGIKEKLVERGVRSDGFKGIKWFADGRMEQLPPRTLGSVGYWIQRPQLIHILQEELPPESIVRGTVDKIEFHDKSADVHVSKLSVDEHLVVKATHVFGCDGIHSIVRSTLEEMDRDFRVHKINCPSAGLCYRATLITPPLDFDPHETFLILGKTDGSFSLLPFCGKHGDPRPLSLARTQDYSLFQTTNAEDLYDMIDQEFPQLNIRECLSLEAATAWCESKGSIFPKPRWSGKAAQLVNDKIVVAIVGDASHSFPPDLGQGVNSGMMDVHAVLDTMDKNQPLTETDLDMLNKTLVEEAEAVCRLLPIGMPYQYKLPHTLSKLVFFASFFTRWSLAGFSTKLSRLTRGFIGPLFTEPAIIQIQNDPPLKYTEILRNHRRNTWLLSSLALVAGWLGRKIWQKM